MKKKQKKYYSKAFLCILTGFLLLATGCGIKREKKLENMNFEELQQKAATALENNSKRAAIMYLEQLVAQHANNQGAATYKLLLADLYYRSARYLESFELYRHFHELYMSDQKAEYAFYKSILSKYKQRSLYDRDSCVIENTLKMCDKYLTTSGYVCYRKDIKDLKRTCVEQLISKEVYVFNSYLHRHRFQSAHNRLNYLREKYLADNPSLEPRLLYLEGKLASYKKEKNIMQERMNTLLEKFPDTRFTRMARGLVKRNFFTVTA